MIQKIVLTGGPGTGKSSIILALEAKGEYVVRESAEAYIKLRQKQGQPEPWTEKNFQEKILELQTQRESEIPEEAERVYLDRGIADGLAYTEPGNKIYDQTLAQAKATRYDKVFLVENLGFTEKTSVRQESNAEAIELGNKLEKTYRSLGYTVERIGLGTVEERVKQVLG